MDAGSNPSQSDPVAINERMFVALASSLTCSSKWTRDICAGPKFREANSADENPGRLTTIHSANSKSALLDFHRRTPKKASTPTIKNSVSSGPDAALRRARASTVKFGEPSSCGASSFDASRCA